MKKPCKGIFFKIFLVALVLFVCTRPGFAADEGNVQKAFQEARHAGVSEKILNRLMVLRYQYDLESSAMVRLMETMGEARASDVPLEPILSKVEEGLAKRVPMPAILRVLQQETGQYRFVRDLLRQALGPQEGREKGFNDQDLIRMTKVLSMDVSRQEMKQLADEAPRVRPGELADGMEFLAALKQAGLGFEAAREVVHTGLQQGFFSKTSWDLPPLVYAAIKKSVPEDRVKELAAEVVRGEMSLPQAQQELGVTARDLARSPQITAPRAGISSQGKGMGQRGRQGSPGGPGPGSPGESGAGPGGASGSGSGAGGGSGGAGGSGGGGGGR
jgi:hypothetical protein